MSSGYVTSSGMKTRLAICALLSLLVYMAPVFAPGAHAASGPTKVTIHVPSKSLAIMPYYFGKDKGFFSPELIEPQLVVMSPPTAIVALVAGEHGFGPTLGGAAAPPLPALPAKRGFLFLSDPRHAPPSPPKNKKDNGTGGKANVAAG